MDDRQPSDAFDVAALAQVAAIRAIGRRRLAAARDLDDFTQEVLLRAYAKRGQLRDVERLPQWIQTIARHTAQDWNRKHRPYVSDLLAELPSSSPSPYERVESDEQWRGFLDALRALSPVDRDLLYSHVVEGAPYEVLEERHGLSRSAVGVRLHRARRRIRHRLRFLLGLGVAFVGRSTTASSGGILAMKWVYGTAIAVACAGALLGGWLWLADADDDDSHRVETRRSVAEAGGATRTPRPAATAEARRTRAASSVTRAGSGGASDDARQAGREIEPNPASQSVGFGAGSSEDRPSPDRAAAESRERLLYTALAEMWPRYLDAVERSNAIQESRPEEPGKNATEAEKQQWREKDATFQAALQTADAECWRFRDHLKEMFPEAITHEVFRDDDGNQTGYSWRLHTDKMRQAVGGRLPSDG